METSLKKSDSIIENVLVNGDLSQLTSSERVMYLKKVCESVGLNPLTKPFEYIKLNGKLTLYAKKDATDQLRQNRGIAITKVETARDAGLIMVTVYASTPDGRTDCDVGVVKIDGLKGDQLANALMKAHTKAKRRVTLSICGLGLLDESELETIPSDAKQEWKEAEVVREEKKELPNPDTGECATDDQVDELNDLILLKLVDNKVYDKWLNKANVKKFEHMTKYQIGKCISYLTKIKNEAVNVEGCEEYPENNLREEEEE